MHLNSPQQVQRLPLVVVGAGLSAANVIIRALKKGIRVVHVFRGAVKDTRIGSKFGGASSSGSEMYSELQALVHLMKLGEANAGGRSSKIISSHEGSIGRRGNGVRESLVKQWNDLLTPYAHSEVVSIDTKQGKCIIASSHPNKRAAHIPVEARRLAILIGSEPGPAALEGLVPTGIGYDDSLHPSYQDANSFVPLGARGKPTHGVFVDVDPFTMSVRRTQSHMPHGDYGTNHTCTPQSTGTGGGLYAVGPLRGDNFVRFLIGDAFAVTRAIRSSSAPPLNPGILI